MWTVYSHITPSNKIYIGITSLKPNCRWDNGNGYSNQSFYKAIIKYGWNNIKHNILFENLSKLDAEMIEEDLIYYYKLIKKNSYNNRLGGNTSNHSEETKEKLRIINTGKKLSEETKKKIGIKSLGKKHSDATKEKLRIINTGKVRSEELKKKLSKIHKGIPCSLSVKLKNSKPVVQLSLDNKIIKIYSSIREAEKITGVCRTHISGCCNNNCQTAGKYRWQFYKRATTEEVDMTVASYNV